LFIRSVPRISYSQLSPATTYVALLKENHTPLTEARNSRQEIRGKPRDLRFSGPFLETLSPILNKFVVSPERSVMGKSVIFPQLPDLRELLINQLADGMQ
jgi:hypothetical protein